MAIPYAYASNPELPTISMNKNKMIAAFAAASMMVPMASNAVFAEETKNTEVKYKAEESFEWIVPESVSMKDASEYENIVNNMVGTIYGVGGVAVTKAILSNDVKISISSGQVDDGVFYLMNGDKKINYKVMAPDRTGNGRGTEVHNDEVVLTQKAGEEYASIDLCYMIDEENVAKIHYAGDYSAIVTFTATSDTPQ